MFHVCMATCMNLQPSRPIGILLGRKAAGLGPGRNLVHMHTLHKATSAYLAASSRSELWRAEQSCVAALAVKPSAPSAMRCPL